MALDAMVSALYARAPARPSIPLQTGRDAITTAVELRRNDTPQGPLDFPGIEVSELTIEGRGGPLLLRIYRPKGVSPRGTVINFHGGGWAIGNLALDDGRLARIALESEVAIVAVDYRLAPEHPFPAALEDGVTALEWAAAGGGPLGLDPHRLIVAGSSAGGNIAAALALKVRHSGLPPLRMQLLNYPVLDGSLDTPSYHEFAAGPGVTRDLMAWFWDVYTNGCERTDPEIAPLCAPDLSDCAPAVIVTAGCDVLRDEAESYARRLEAARVPTILKRYDGMPHGFLSLPIDIPQAREAINLSIEQIRRHLV